MKFSKRVQTVNEQGRSLDFESRRSECHWSEADALLAVKCCFDNSRCADFFGWKACRVAALPKDHETHPSYLRGLPMSGIFGDYERIFPTVEC